MRQSLWLFPVLETVHLLGIVALVGSIAAFDLRLLGWVLRGQRVTDLVHRLFPWAWAGFVVQVITGAMLFSSEAVHIERNPAFRLKMLLILLAGVHALVFQFTVYRNVARWDESAVPPFGAKLAGVFSIMLWIGIVAAGRFIGFV